MTFIIAEVGSNWSTRTDIMTSIQMAKQVGADAVKFQCFRTSELFGFRFAEGKMVLDLGPYQEIGGQQIHEHLPAMEEKAKAAGIELMVTAFSPEGVMIVNPYVKRHKIASSDLTYPDLLEAVAKTKKPVLLSTGCSTAGDISAALQLLKANGSGPVTLMYCVSAYPSREHDLWGIERLRDMYPGYQVGFSDHSVDIYTPISAVHHFQVPVLEKHFQVVDGTFPDSPHSLSVDLFKKMVARIRGDDLGPTKHQTAGEEREMRTRHNRRLIATRTIKQGEKLVYRENFGAYRSLRPEGRGLNPFLILDQKRSPNGKIAQREIQQGEGIGPGDFG